MSIVFDTLLKNEDEIISLRVINERPIPNVSCEERSSGYDKPPWNYSQNPVIPRDLLPISNGIFNSAEAARNGESAGVFCCDNWARQMKHHRGFSKDGLGWKLDPEPLMFR